VNVAAPLNPEHDQGDSNPGNGICSTITGTIVDGAPACGLRAAIEEANANPGHDTIEFDFAAVFGSGPFTFVPTSPLPAITEEVTIDGTTEPNYTTTPIVVLSGGSAGGAANGLTIGVGPSLITGLEITAFAQDGIAVTAGNNIDLRGNEIYANGGLGIDLGNDGLTADDVGDVDTGPNSRQNHGFLSSAFLNSAGTSMTVSGYGSGGTPFTTYRIDAYSNTACDSSDFGEGQFLLSSFNLTSDAMGEVSATGTLAAPVSGSFLSYKTTNLTTNETSEFANCIQIFGDSDNDGIQNAVDASYSAGVITSQSSNPTNWSYAFDYGSHKSWGTISPTGASGLSVSLDATTGNIALGSSGMTRTFTGCDGSYVVTVSAGGLALQDCGSITIEALKGTISVAYGTMSVSVPIRNAVTVSDLGGGSYKVEADADNTVPLVAGGVSVNPGANSIMSDTDGDALANAADNCPSFATAWDAAPADTDCDGYADTTTYGARTSEAFVGTDPADGCADTTTPNDEEGPGVGEPVSPWAPDTNDNRIVQIGDVLAVGAALNTSPPNPNYKARFDWNGNGLVSIQDLLQVGPFLNKSCTP
jgi:hypothetical protein